MVNNKNNTSPFSPLLLKPKITKSPLGLIRYPAPQRLCAQSTALGLTQDHIGYGQQTLGLACLHSCLQSSISPLCLLQNHSPQPDNIRFSSPNPKKCVCASVAHVLSVTLSQRKSTKEVYRKFMRNMRTDAIVNQCSATRTPTVL